MSDGLKVKAIRPHEPQEILPATIDGPMAEAEQALYDLGQEPRNFGNIPALYNTNEVMSEGTLETVRDDPEAPNGYIVGPGAGMILRLPEASKPDEPIKGIVSIDITAESALAIATLQAASKRQQGTLEAALGDILDNLDTFRKQLLAQEKHPWKRHCLETASEERLATYLADALGRNGDVALSYVSILPQLKDNIVDSLLAEDKVAAAVGDLTDPAIFSALTQLPGFSTSRNIFYVSNIADYVDLQPLLDAINQYTEGTQWLAIGSDNGKGYYECTLHKLEKQTPTTDAALEI